ncbi:MAG TPA: type II secretion system protein [Candidatus Angelobacter sp.]|nr:type II secretion system protein [Candidatus Angelobacter sp.]
MKPIHTRVDQNNARPTDGGRSYRARRVTCFHAFTLIELLVVIGIIALLAGLVVGGTRYAGSKMKEDRIRTELNALATAIEAYNAKFGHYPPDNVVRRAPVVVVNSVSNSLFYELSGVIVENNRNGMFHLPNRTAGFGSSTLSSCFGVDGIENADTDPKKIVSFLPHLKAGQHAVINPASASLQGELEVLVVPVPWPLTAVNQPTSVKGLNPWHYVRTQATNNPASFDLWAEYVDGGKVKIICNWSKDILEPGQ